MKCFVPFDESLLDGIEDQVTPSTLVPYEYDYCCWRVFREENGTEVELQTHISDELQTDWSNHCTDP